MAAQREIHDHFFREARKHGYVARSAYKLLEIQERRKIIRPGDRVLDLGCAPGAWLQVACRALGPRSAGGLVLGIDLKPVRQPLKFGDDRVRTIEGDAFEITPEQLAEVAGPEPFNVVLSDMMASTTGHHATDHLRSVALARRALEMAMRALAPTGRFVCKVFEGSEYPAFLDECREVFAKVKGFAPKASRAESTEMFVVAEGFSPHNR